MPRRAADLEEALNKKGGLTLSQLANYDDLVTDALVDQACFWTTIRKLKSNYHPSRGVQQEVVCKILQEHVIVEKDSAAAHKKLLELKGLANYLRTLRSEDEKEHFERHLRKYINIYLPECPFEVCTTNRYAISTPEACIKARKHIRTGESIKYLTGIQVEMTEQEEKELSNRTDFSIVLSSRRKRPSLFLGPARFANHDCDSNARLTTSGKHGIHIVARKEIEVGEEITVTYGVDYFGEDNCECLCGTCEEKARNGWDPRGPLLRDDSSDEDEDENDDQKCRPRSARRKNTFAEHTQRSSPHLGKRKRGSDVPTSGRTRGQDSDARQLRGRLRKVSRTAPLAHAKNELTRPLGGASLFKRLSSSFSPTPSAAKVSTGDPMLLNIWNVLTRIGDRKLRGLNPASLAPEEEIQLCVTPEDLKHDPTVQVPRRTRRGAALSRAQQTDEDQPDPSMLTPSAVSPPYAKHLSRKSSAGYNATGDGLKRDSPLRSAATRSSLSKIAKDRAESSLRHVRNVTEEGTDIWSIPASPSPEDRSQQRRGQGRPQRNLRGQEVQESSDSTSPPSVNDDAGNGSSSSESLASSATTADGYTAGNIAQNICDMLVIEETEGDGGKQRQAHSVMEEALQTDGMDLDAAEIANAPDASSAPISSIERRSHGPKPSNTEEKRGPIRTPGDYHLCKSLLSTPYSRWIECRNCDEYFLQHDAYLTRIACQRCERHSKLYGYYWPKTDKEGKWDFEERVLDHRTVHRFIEPGEERQERKGRKTVEQLLLVARLESEDAAAVMGENVSVKRLRNSPRRSESRRKMRGMV